MMDIALERPFSDLFDTQNGQKTTIQVTGAYESRRIPAGISDAIVALDPGADCGWAVADTTGRVLVSGEIALSEDSWTGGGARYLRLARALDELVAPIYTVQGSVGLIAYEQAHRHGGVAAARAYGGHVAIITSWAERQGLPYTGIHVATARKTVFGRGNLSKADAGVQLRELYPKIRIRTHNQADAITIAVAAARLHDSQAFTLYDPIQAGGRVK